jgi:hypothetical protein
VGRKAGLSDEKLRAVPGNDLTPLNETERLVIELADALTNTPSDVSDDLYARLRNQFSEEQLMQLAAQIAFENYRARWNRLFNVESDNLYYGGSASSSGTKSTFGRATAWRAPNGADGLPQLRDPYHLLDDFKPFQTRPNFAWISSTSSSGVHSNSIVIASSSGSGSSKSAN